MSDLIERLGEHIAYYDNKAAAVSNLGKPRTDNDYGRMAGLLEEAAAHIRELEAERDQQGKYACEIFDECIRVKAERDGWITGHQNMTATAGEAIKRAEQAEAERDTWKARAHERLKNELEAREAVTIERCIKAVWNAGGDNTEWHCDAIRAEFAKTKP